MNVFFILAIAVTIMEDYLLKTNAAVNQNNVRNNYGVEYWACADGIRGFACLNVLIAHAVTLFFKESAPYLAGSGKIGVWLFFVLSAFLLTRKFINTKLSLSSLLDYIGSRFIRIIPLYVIAVLVYKFLGTTEIVSWKDVEDAVFLRQGFSHLWTVAVEFKFYLYLPFFAFVFINLSSTWVLSVISLICLVLIEQISHPYWLTSINSINVNDYLTPFTLGVFSATFYEKLKPYVTAASATWVGVATMIFCIMLLPGVKNFFLGLPLDLSLANKFVYFGFLWAVFIIYTIDGLGLFGKILRTRMFRVIGNWSYSIYLFHWLVFMKYIILWPHNYIAMLCAIVSAIFLGGLSYYILEKNLQQFRHRMQSQFIKTKLGQVVFARQ